ncbi:Origin recognition complex subunit 1 [Cucumispora dikerogammari]|nr:Origin recognition complex subunit 1 [Cucumispora dikerogammari]
MKDEDTSKYLIKEREKEQTEIINYITRFINKQPINNIIHIYGIPGVGKTFTIKNSIKYFQQKKIKSIKNKNLNEKIDFIYFNSSENHQTLFKILKNRKKRLVLIIDEIDMFSQKYFYTLFDTVYNLEDDILLFIISNTFLLTKIKNKKNVKINKLLSRIGSNSIKFEPYTFSDFKDKCKNKYVARYLSTFGDMRKLEVANEIIEGEDVSEVKIVKDKFVQLIDLIEISETERKVLMFFCSLKKGFKEFEIGDYFSFCRIRGLDVVDVFEFEWVLSNLVRKGFLNKNFELNYLKEEMKNVFNEEIF